MIDDIITSLTDNNAEWPGEDESDGGQIFDTITELHKGILAPSHVEISPEAAKIDDQWTKTVWAEGFPTVPDEDGFLREFFNEPGVTITEPGVNVDVAIHIDPRDTEQAKAKIQDTTNELEAMKNRKEEQGDMSWRTDETDRQHWEDVYDALEGESKVFDVSLYVTVRAADRDRLNRAVREVQRVLKEQAHVTPKTATNRQDKGLRSTSPIGQDDLAKQSLMTGGAIGTMFPFSSRTLIEETGIEYGLHAEDGNPILVSRFQRETGYNMLVIGDIGSGKSVSTNLQIIRRMMFDRDTIVVLLDPVGGFYGLNKALGGKHVVVGGQVGVNPLEIKPTPEEILEQTGHDLDPYAAKLKNVANFFDNYFERRGNPLGDRRGVLEKAVKVAYERRDITRDPSTHHKESPTIQDVREILIKMADHPEKFSDSGSETVHEKLQDRASDLLIELEPFTEGGEFENLSGQTDEKVDISDEQVVYLDLQQQEGADETGLMLQLLINAVYQRAKDSDKRVIFAIDEAHYLMDSDNLDFLERSVRHSRHYGLSIQLITQTIDEFFQHDEAEVIADNCSMKLLHQITGMDEDLAAEFDLTSEQMNFVKNAEPGDKDQGFSEALLGVGGEGWYPLHIRANETEMAVADFDADEDEIEDLPGMGESEEG